MWKEGDEEEGKDEHNDALTFNCNNFCFAMSLTHPFLQMNVGADCFFVYNGKLRTPM